MKVWNKQEKKILFHQKITKKQVVLIICGNY
jgi:hypothetical protein